MKRMIPVLLAFVMILSAVVPAAFAEEKQPEVKAETSVAPEEAKLLSVQEAEAQLELIASEFSSLRQDENGQVWHYAVTDLDRNGRLEFLAMPQHVRELTATPAVWELDSELKSLKPCAVELSDGNSYPNIVYENADAVYEETTDTWQYLFFDEMNLSDGDAYTFKNTVTFKDGSICFEELASQHVTVTDGKEQVFYSDAEGNAISQEEYEAAGINTAKGQQIRLGWMLADEITTDALTDSYAAFYEAANALSAPVATPAPTPRVKPTPTPTVKPTPAPTATPAPTPTATPSPTPTPVIINITKHPTNEYHCETETAWFVAMADNWTSLKWTFVDPDGREYSVGQMKSNYPNSPIEGDNGSYLSIRKLTTDLHRFGVYCTFSNGDQTARTSTAYLYVSSSSAPGRVVYIEPDDVTIELDGGGTVVVPINICEVRGVLDLEDRCMVYHDGYGVKPENVTYVYIYGAEPMPVRNSMAGTVIDSLMSTVTIQLENGDEVQVMKDIVNLIEGSLAVGCDCTVYYDGDIPTVDSIFSVDVYGVEVGDESDAG